MYQCIKYRCNWLSLRNVTEIRLQFLKFRVRSLNKSLIVFLQTTLSSTTTPSLTYQVLARIMMSLSSSFLSLFSLLIFFKSFSEGLNVATISDCLMLDFISYLLLKVCITVMINHVFISFSYTIFHIFTCILSWFSFLVCLLDRSCGWLFVCVFHFCFFIYDKCSVQA